MNVFRSRKKSIGEIDLPRPSLDNQPPLPKHARTIFGRKKPQLEQKREEPDIKVALPSNDDFRTSLIMPNLAQRFSMLREQDDPKTKIGKASDDSVLFPKRASRLDLFGLGNLDDIAEVSSITGSFRPPFAQDGRTNSYASDGYDGYASDTGSANGSIMGRSRPGQGNKLFGGRQKVYKIPTNGPASKAGNTLPESSGGSGRGLGKAVYEDDISSSLWQRMRAEERAKRSLDHDFSEANIDGRLSPSFHGYNRNRETSSSTNSYERMSTAATSMTSMNDGSTVSLPAMMSKEPARDRPLNKRMYGQGIDQQVHEQQNSAMQRLNSVRGGRGFGGLGLSKNSQRPGAASAASSIRSGSPSPALNPSPGFDFGTEKQAQLSLRDVDSGYQGSSAMPSPISPHTAADPTLAAHIDPNDLGKATASGTFNKPKARYDDQQFAQRQLQLREGRDASRDDNNSRSETPSDRVSSRLRKDSDTSTGRGTPTQNFSRIRGNRSVSRESDLRHTSGQSRHGSSAPDASDSEESFAHSSPRARGVSASASQQSTLEEQHPALRAPITEEEEEPVHNLAGSLRVPGGFESPVLGSTSGGLNEMVRGHLRNQSDASSVYSDTVGSQSAQHSYHSSISNAAPEQRLSKGDPKVARLDDPTQRIRANSAARNQLLAVQLRDDYANHTRSPSNDTLLERDAFADELADRRRQVEEKLRNIAESRANFESSNGFGLLKKSTSRSSLANEGNPMTGLKRFMSGSGSATPTGDEDRADNSSPRRPPNDRRLSDLDQERNHTAGGSSAPRSPVRVRDIGAERRARHAANMRSPTGTGPAAPRGQVEARKQQFAGATGTLPRDFTERVVSNPDHGKPHYHPAGRARHYSPPRANTTPDQKPHLPPQATQDSRPTQRSASKSRFEARGPSQPDVESPQMVTRGTFPPPAGAPIQYASARKRSVSKAEISSPVTLLSSTYAESTVDLSPGASLENGMDEIRAAEASANPPPVPPINPRRRAMGTLRKMTRSNTSSPDSEEDGSVSPRPGLRKQMSEGSNLRGRIRERIAMPASPPKNH